MRTEASRLKPPLACQVSMSSTVSPVSKPRRWNRQSTRRCGVRSRRGTSSPVKWVASWKVTLPSSPSEKTPSRMTAWTTARRQAGRLKGRGGSTRRIGPAREEPAVSGISYPVSRQSSQEVCVNRMSITPRFRFGVEGAQQLEPLHSWSNRFNCAAAASSVSSRLQKANRTNRRPSAGW